METTTMKTELESLLGKAAADFVVMHDMSKQARRYGLAFPKKRDGSLRISEQEAKHIFVEHLKAGKQFSYSVETPTTQKYRQKGVSEMSARVDLTLERYSGERAHIEFKAHYCGVENIRKDWEKLLREDVTGVWFHTLERGNASRVGCLLETIRRAFGQLSAHIETSKRSYLISICSLETRTLYWSWLTFAGSIDLNLAAIESLLRQGALDSGLWHMIQLDADGTRPSDATDKCDVSKTAYKGKGAREGFFVYAPGIAVDTYMHLSGRGDSYRFRNFRTKTAKAVGFRQDGYPTLESLRTGAVITKWLSVTAEDSRHNIIDEPGYWYDRIRQINRQYLPASESTIVDELPPGAAVDASTSPRGSQEVSVRF